MERAKKVGEEMAKEEKAEMAVVMEGRMEMEMVAMEGRVMVTC